MKKTLIISFILLFNSIESNSQKANPTKGEIIYHVCQRSFYDSNGDSNGDLKGLQQKLGYLKDLGITSILLLPLYDADCYHNYFANDFEKIDAEFGTMKDYIDLVKAVHKLGLKIYLDMETQYVTEKHLWWKDAVGNLKSPYSDYILFDDDAHKTPSTMVFGLRELNSYDGSSIKATTVNLNNTKMLEYNKNLFSFFVDPNKDGKFNDGADGFRLDHAMDNLDDKKQLTNLFSTFWKPLIDHLKKQNPDLQIVAEQADWNDYGFDYFNRAGVDRMFGFGLQKAIIAFDKNLLIKNADSILANCPKGKNQVIFLENHDIDRFASVEKNFKKQKLAAGLMLFIGGIPSIYYGQELGMLGKNYTNGKTDGNGIPSREAFEWFRTIDKKGMAIWYKNTGQWWDETNLNDNDGISLEEEKSDENSLFNYYKNCIAVKQSNAALSLGNYQNVKNNNQQVFSFYRIYNNQKVLVVANLSSEIQKVVLTKENRAYTKLFGKSNFSDVTIELPPFDISVFEIN